jgi:hypothetical protein
MGDVISDPEKFRLGWIGGKPETPCGYGSTMAATRSQRHWIPTVIDFYRIRTIVDVGAGDMNWIRHTDLRGAQYTPLDLVPRLPEVKEFNLLLEVPPAADLLICLWVLNHLPYDDCRKAIANLKASGSRLLLMTDRPRWHHEQPPEIQMEYIEELPLNDKGDRILLCPL